VTTLTTSARVSCGNPSILTELWNNTVLFHNSVRIELILSVWCQHREYRHSELTNFAYRLQQVVVGSNGSTFWETESNRIANRNALLSSGKISHPHCINHGLLHRGVCTAVSYNEVNIAVLLTSLLSAAHVTRQQQLTSECLSNVGPPHRACRHGGPLAWAREAIVPLNKAKYVTILCSCIIFFNTPIRQQN